MTPRQLLLTTLASLACAATAIDAQPPRARPARRLPVSDSTGAYVAIASRHLWRDVTLARGAAVRTGAAVRVRRGMLLEYEGGTAVQERERDGRGDQYSLGLNYELPFAGPPSGGSVVFGVNGYATPNLTAAQSGVPHGRGELALAVLRDVRIPSQGIRTIALRAEIAQDVTHSHATWLAGSASASLGTTKVVGVIEHVMNLVGRVSGSASNLDSPLSAGPRPAFGYHSADATVSFDYRRHDPLATKAFSAALDVTEAIRANRLGGSTLVVQLRGSVLLL